MAQIKTLPPLPETAYELCAVARDLHADSGEMRLGARATEMQVKRLSANGDLARYVCCTSRLTGRWPASSTKIASPA